MEALGHFVYLFRMQARNRARGFLARMKKPQYAIAMVLGLAYFGMILRFWAWSGEDNAPGTALLGGIALTVPIMLAIVVAWWWLWGGHRFALSLDRAEVQHLVAGPFTRRDLINYKLLKAQPAVWLTALLIGTAMGGTPLPWALRVPTIWLLFTTLHLHQIIASLTHAGATEKGLTGLKRMWLPITVFSAALAGFVWTLAALLRQLKEVDSAQALGLVFAAALDTPVANTVLFPFDLVLAPTFSLSLPQWAEALPGAVALLALHYVWILRTDTAFEEAAAEAGRNKAGLVEAVKDGRLAMTGNVTVRVGATPFPLRPVGRPAVALLWKNSVSFVRQLQSGSPIFWPVAPVFLYVVLLYVSGEPDTAATAIAGIFLVLGGMLTVLGPLAIRNDFRDDLRRLPLLRSYPLASRDIVLAELASSTLAVSLAQLAMVGVGLAILVVSGPLREHLALTAAGFAGAVVVLPPVNGVSLSIHNAQALLLPAWTPLGPKQAGGLEVMGQQMILVALTGSVLLLALLAPLMAAATVTLRIGLSFGAIAIAVVAALITLWAELALVVTWLSEVFDATDPPELGAVRS